MRGSWSTCVVDSCCLGASRLGFRLWAQTRSDPEWDLEGREIRQGRSSGQRKGESRVPSFQGQNQKNQKPLPQFYNHTDLQINSKPFYARLHRNNINNGLLID